MTGRRGRTVALCLIAVATALASLPVSCNSNELSSTEPQVLVFPEHWVQVSLGEEEMQTLEDLWQTRLNRKQFLQAICPGMLSEFPAQAATVWESMDVKWPGQPFSEWKECQCWNMCTKTPDQPPFMYDIYLGGRELEVDSTFSIPGSFGLLSANRYRVSIYTDDVLGHLEGPVDGGRLP